MRLPELSIKNWRFTLIIVILFLSSGILSYLNMPRNEDPQLEFPGAIILGIWPGASPEDIEKLVTDLIEEEINELDRIKDIQSSISEGFTLTQIRFENGTDPDDSYQKLVSAIDNIRPDMPTTLHSLTTEIFSSNNVNVMQIALQSNHLSYKELHKEGEDLKQRLLQIASVNDVDILASPEQEIVITLNTQKIEKLGIPLSTVIQVLQSNNANIPAGNARAGKREFTVKTSGSYKNIDEIKTTPIRSSQQGIITIQDIATVMETDKVDSYNARFNGNKSVWITVKSKKTANVLDLGEKLRSTLDEFRSDKNENLSVELVFDQSKSVKERLDGFFINLLQGIAFVGIILLFVLGVRISVIVMLVIPISVMSAIGLLDMTGGGLDQVSIMGLIVSIGLIVDNAIVVSENIGRMVKEGVPFKEAVIQGPSQVGWAIISSTATTIFAFLPMLFLNSDAGVFIRSMPLVVIFTLTGSMLLSLTFTPFLMKIFFNGVDVKKYNAKVSLVERMMYSLASGVYRKTLLGAIKNPVIPIILAVLIFGGSYLLYHFDLVGVSLFPKAEKNYVLINVETPPGTPMDITDEKVKQLEEMIKDEPFIVNVASNIGKSNPVIYYNEISNKEAVNIAQLLLETKSANLDSVERLVDVLREKVQIVAGAKIQVKEFLQGENNGAPIEVRIISSNFKELRERAAEAEEILKRIEGTTNVNNSSSNSRTNLKLDYNREKMALLNVPVSEVDLAVRYALSGVVVGEYQDKSGDKHDIRVMANEKNKGTTDDLHRLTVNSLTGKQIPLMQFAEPRFEEVSSVVKHYGLERIATVNAFPQTGFNNADITKQFVTELEKLPWSNSLRYSVGGEEESRKNSFGGMEKALLIALAMIFAVLVLQFGTYLQPVVVFTAIPFSLVGAIWGLFIAGYTFSFAAFIGVTSLVGIVVNNSIILVDYANSKRKEGMTVLEAAVEAGVKRFTPIILTTLTTVAGLVPLILTESTMWAPMAWTISGGLLFSTFLTLIVVPTLYKMFTK